MPEHQALPRWYSGDAIMASELNELARGIEDTSRLTLTRGYVSPTFTGTSDKPNQFIFCKVLDRNGASGPYAFKEYQFEDYDESPTYVELEGGMSSYSNDGTNAWAFPLYEINNAYVPYGTYVWAMFAEDGGYALFEYSDTRITAYQQGTLVGTEPVLNFRSTTFIAPVVADNTVDDKLEVTFLPTHAFHNRIRKLVSFRGC